MKTFILFLITTCLGFAQDETKKSLQSYIVEIGDLENIAAAQIPIPAEDHDPFDDDFDENAVPLINPHRLLLSYLTPIHPPNFKGYFSPSDVTYDTTQLLFTNKVSLQLSSWAIYNYSTKRLHVFATPSTQQQIKYLLGKYMNDLPSQYTSTIQIKGTKEKRQINHFHLSENRCKIGEHHIKFTIAPRGSTVNATVYKNNEIVAQANAQALTPNTAWELKVNEATTLIFKHSYAKMTIPIASDGAIIPQRLDASESSTTLPASHYSIGTFKVPPALVIPRGSIDDSAPPSDDAPYIPYFSPGVTLLKPTIMQGYIKYDHVTLDITQCLIQQGIPLDKSSWAIMNQSTSTLIVYTHPKNHDLIEMLCAQVGHRTPTNIQCFAEIISHPLNRTNPKTTLHSSFAISSRHGDRATCSALNTNNSASSDTFRIEPTLAEDGRSVSVLATIHTSQQLFSVYTLLVDGIPKTIPLYKKKDRQYSLKITSRIQRPQPMYTHEN